MILFITLSYSADVDPDLNLSLKQVYCICKKSKKLDC